MCALSRLSEFKVNGSIPMLRVPRRLLDSTAFLTEFRMAMVLRDKDLRRRARHAGREARLSTLQAPPIHSHPFLIGRGARRVSISKHNGNTRPAHAWWERLTDSGSYLALGTGLLDCPASADRGPGGAGPALGPGLEGWLAPRGTVAFSWPTEAGVISKLGATCQRRKQES